MVGDFAAGISIYQEEMKGCILRDYHSTYLGNLCLIYWMDADLIAMRQTAECALNAAKHHQLPDTVLYVLYFLEIFHFHQKPSKDT
jgi:hypothetical protein